MPALIFLYLIVLQDEVWTLALSGGSGTRIA
jgi:hypothetical protein